MSVPSVTDVPHICIILVGQDLSGHWLVQENHGLMGGIFVSRDAAIHFAQVESEAYPGSSVELVPAPMTWIAEKAA